MISKDGMCCLLRPDLPLRWSCWPEPLSVPPLIPLCTPASPTPSSQQSLCVPLFPCHTLAFLPCLACIVLPSLCPVAFCLFRAGVSKLFFLPKDQIENTAGFVCCTISVATTHLCCCSTKTGKDNTSANGCSCVPVKLYFKNQAVAVLAQQAVVCRLFSEHGG